MDPVTIFFLSYVGEKLANSAYDAVTGKPDIYELDRRLKELEDNPALRADIQSQVRALRLRLDGSVTKQQYLELVKKVGEDIAVINARLDGVEERVERLEVELADAKGGTAYSASSAHFVDRAKKCLEGKEFHRAIANCNIAVSVDSANAEAYFCRAQSFFNLNAPPQLAEVDYSQAIRLDPKHAEAYWCRSYQWRRMGDFERAIDDLNRAIELRPGAHHMLGDRGYVRLLRAEFELAKQDYTAAIALDPGVSNHFAFRAWALTELGKVEAAVSDCESARRLDGSSTLVCLVLCRVYDRKEDYRGMVSEASKAIALDSTLSSAFDQRGYAYSKLGDWKQAESDFATSCRLNPNNANARANLEVARVKLIPEPTDSERIVGKWKGGLDSIEFFKNGDYKTYATLVTWNGTWEIVGERLKVTMNSALQPDQEWTYELTDSKLVMTNVRHAFKMEYERSK